MGCWGLWEGWGQGVGVGSEGFGLGRRVLGCVGGLWVGVGGDEVGFEGVQVRGLGSRRSEELGGKGQRGWSWDWGGRRDWG